MSEWTHQAHLVAGYWYVMTLGPAGALAQLRERISRHNEGVGTANTDSSGYQESITRLYVAGIASHVAATPGLAFEQQLASLLASPMSTSAWPLQYYSRERLFSVPARRGWRGCWPCWWPPMRSVPST